MEYITIGKEELTKGKIVYLKCNQNENCRNINIKDLSYLLLILTEGSACFKIGDKEITCIAPCFVCFNESVNPVLLKKSGLKAKALYFNPCFLNVNMTFDFIKNPDYSTAANAHDLFLLTPFTDGDYVVPITELYLNSILSSFSEICKQLKNQPDFYWSCRSRSYFIDIIMILEKHYRMKNNGDISYDNDGKTQVKCNFTKRALLYIEANYMCKITLDDILKSADTNHTTLTYSFKNYTGKSVMEYVNYYRIEVAKKKLRFTDIPLKEIALSCGFITTEHFSRIFKKNTGTSPALFRKVTVEKRKREIYNKIL